MKKNQSAEIQDVSDTALWVAVYRAQETERANPLFRDPLAALLVGERGRKIAKGMSGSRYTAWSVVLRTCVIDAFIQEQVALGVDCVLNLGAGLDTRPYRLELPAGLRWVEVDYPHMIQRKNELLSGEKPRCRLDRMPLDLAERNRRLELFQSLAAEARKVLVLTEGVIPYLPEKAVAELADDLASQPKFAFWIVDYFSPLLYARFRNKKREKEMRNAPIQFLPADIFGFLGEHGWTVREIRYLVEESMKLGRKFPLPLWARIFSFFANSRKKQDFRKMLGYALLEPKQGE
jgi:methyltransferase (TIGR00027 family)